MSSASFALHLRRRVPVVLQAEAAECGLACLAMIANYYGFETDLTSLRMQFTTSLRGITLAQLITVASQLRLSGRALRLDVNALSRLRTPSLLHWNLDHFVVLERANSRYAWIVDPAAGRRKLSIKEMSKHFTGVALELSPAENFTQGRVKNALTLGQFFGSAKGLRSNLVKLFWLSVSLQVFTLLSPFYSQFVIDEAVTTVDHDLLTLLAIAAMTVTVLTIAIGAARTFLVMNFGSHLQFEWAARLFHHLIRLPADFFEKRYVADVLSRFKSLGAIQGLVTTTIVEAIMDGMMATTTLVVMLYYNPLLALVPIVALTAYTCVRILTYGPQRENAQEVLVRGARESSHFLESLRGILAIKNFSKEEIREARWQNYAADAISANYKAAAFGMLQGTANQLLFGVEGVVVMWLGAKAVMSGEFSVGMLVAFMAYKVQFTARGGALIDKLWEYRLASVHLDRLSDIALASPESGLDTGTANQSTVTGQIRAEGIWFRHASTEPYVLADVNLDVRAGECIAIVGPSGVGKTTLLKILTSLLRPEKGQVLVDGRDIFQASVSGYRRQIATVMQEDTLLSGTLCDNIAFFDPRPDLKHVELCAKLAAIHDDISTMPMKYLTLVGDMGATLSGGQKQRVLLARALYCRPKILFLDEATSHLDPATERHIHDALARMNITRIIVAHRRETLAIADRVVQMQGDRGGSSVSRLLTVSG